MVKIQLDSKLSVAENANVYYDQAKKAKKKLPGAKKAIEFAKGELEKLIKERDKQLQKFEEQAAKQDAIKNTKKEWFENFRWFYTSKGHLVIGGRDATTNEIVVKKHADDGDLIFHTDMAGSPFFILKLEGDEASDNEKLEVANATVTYSRAWKMGFASNKVFWVTPSQVTKEAQSGENLGKGSFMIRGKTNYVSDIEMELCMGLIDGKLQAGPFSSLYEKLEKAIILIQGNRKASDVAKEIKKSLDYDNVNDIISKLPAGTFDILDDRRVKEKLLNMKYSKKK